MRVLFIGLGNMGGPMAARLVAGSHEVLGRDVSPGAVEALIAAGGRAADGDAAATAEAIVTMLPAGAHVREVYEGPNGLIARARPGALLIDTSTIDVATARDVAGKAEARGLAMLDAPVSGGTAGAAAGTLAFMVGGADEALEHARPLLEAMGSRIVHAGASGAGQAAKICNNMILGVTMIATCEAFALGRALGLEDQKLFDVVANSSGQSWSMTSYCPVPGPVPTSPANRDYAPGFAAAMMLKDLKLARDAADETKAPTLLGAEATRLYEAFVAAGHEGSDFSAIMRSLANLAVND